MKRKKYASDISPEKFAQLEPLLRSVRWRYPNRRLWKNCERLLNTSLQFVHLAFLALLLRRA